MLNIDNDDFSYHFSLGRNNEENKLKVCNRSAETVMDVMVKYKLNMTS